MFLKNKNIISKIRRSKVTDYAALNVRIFQESSQLSCFLLTIHGQTDVWVDRLTLYYNADQTVSVVSARAVLL